MFNGLVRTLARVTEFDGRRLRVEAALDVRLGDSVALNGACLSVTECFAGGFAAELSSESLAVLAAENYAVGARLHAEPAMRLGERVDGHLVQGHIDALGVLERVEARASGSDFYVRLPRHAAALVAPKGSVCVEGVSLTASEVAGDVMRLSLIPLTLKDTLFGEFRVGRRLQIETDLFARYVARILGFGGGFGLNAGANSNLDKNQTKNGELSQELADFYTQIY